MPLSVLLLALSAPQQRTPDAYSCSADAFTTIAAIHGRGEGSVSLSTDGSYRPQDATFTYRVMDRIGGLGRFTATWTLAGRSFDDAVFTGLRIPLWDWHPDRFTVTVALDGATVATRRYRRDGEGVVPIDGPAPRWPGNVIASDPYDPWLPDLRGHRTFSYVISMEGSDRTGGEMILLPDWRAQAGAIAGARRAAEKLAAKRRCNPAYILRGAD